jgi:pimeloyl-ACP methyl ester carboxylesterase
MPSIAVNGTEHYYERHGSGRPVVCIHGSGWDHRQWAPQVETLTDELEIITYDVSGHGQSESSPRRAVTFEDQADDLRALLDALDIESPVLVGCSMGGRIAYEYAAKHPTELDGLVTLEAAPPSWDCPKWQVPLRRLAVAVVTRLGPIRVWEFQQWLSSLRESPDEEADDSGSDETTVLGLGMSDQEYYESAKRQLNSDAMASGMRGNVQLLVDDDDIPPLDNISVPALILDGEHGSDVFREAADTLADRIASSRRETVPGGGHAANIENHEAFNALLRDFVEDIEADEPATQTAD